MHGPSLFSRKDRIKGTSSGSCEELKPRNDTGKRSHRYFHERRQKDISSPESALEIPISSTLGLTPLRKNTIKLIREGCRSTPSVIGRDNSTGFAAKTGMIREIEDSVATMLIGTSVWFVNGRGRSFHDDEFFTRMAKITEAVMPLLLTNSNNSFFQTFASSSSTLSLSKATEKLKLENHSKDAINKISNQPPPYAQQKKYSREFELFICNILKKTGLSSIVLLLALKYIHRLRLAYPEVAPTTGAEYRLFSVAMILANKYLEDRTFTNKTWASLTAMPISEVNIMEREFLTILDFNLGVNDIEFCNWISTIEGFLRALGAPSTPIGASHQMLVTPTIEK